LDEIRLAETGLNKYYNSGRFPKTMGYLFEEKRLNPYETFKKLGSYLRENEEMALQPGDLAKALFIALGSQDDGRLLFLIKQDYLIFSKLKPSLWWKYEISKEEKAQVFKKFLKVHPELTKEIIYRDTRLEKFETDSETKYFLITYHPKNTFFLTIKK
jgi:Mg2+ and Co2+ transporter CorA